MEDGESLINVIRENCRLRRSQHGKGHSLSDYIFWCYRENNAQYLLGLKAKDFVVISHFQLLHINLRINCVSSYQIIIILTIIFK
jgi:hypothetical protein